jgi:spoIIIJ-associated protein
MSVIKHEIESRGSDVEAAVQSGLVILGAKRNEVVIEVVDEGSRGLLGIGKRDAVVKLTRMVDTAQPRSAPKQPAPVVEVVEEPEEDDWNDEDDWDDEDDSAESEEAIPDPEPVVEVEVQPEPVVAESAPIAEEAEDTQVEDEEDYVIVDEADIEVIAELLSSEEVRIAMMHAEAILEKMGVEAVVSADVSDVDEVTEKRIPIIKIDGENVSDLIGSRGATLNAIQFLLRQMTSQSIHDRTNFALDIGGYRERRQAVLADLARRTADKAVRDGRSVTLNAMPPHERRIVHMTLRDDARVETRSSGEGDQRRVRIMPKGASGGGKRKRRRRRSNTES